MTEKSFSYKKIIAALGVFVLYALMFLFLIYNTGELTDSIEPLTVGDVVKREVAAKKNIKFIDEIATENLKRQAAENSCSIYTRDNSSLESTKYYLNQDSLYNVNDKEKYDRIEMIINEIYKRGYFDINELNHDKKDRIEFEGAIYPKSDVLTSSNIRSYILTHFKGRDDLNIKSRDENFIFNSVPRYLTPNAVYNIFQTTAREKEEQNKIQPVIVDIDAGDLILVKDEIVTQQKYDNLMKIKRLEAEYNFMTILFCIIFSFFFIIFSFYLLDRFVFSKNKLRGSQYYIISIVSQVVFILLSILEFWIFIKIDTKFLNAWSLVCLPSIMVYGSTGSKRAGYFLLMLNSVLLIIIPFINWNLLLRSIIVSVMIMELFNSCKEEGSLIKKWLLFILFVLLVVVMADFPIFTTIKYVAMDVVFEVIKCMVCYAAAYVFNKLIQNTLNMPTKARLERLANSQNNLLDKFKSLCTGSFEHSEIVADIAENAANAIGANALLTKVAARFHDIGKMEHPEYFVENQKSGVSKHQVIKNKLSAAIIKSHVPLGVKLLKEHNFPPEVIQIVSQHHGNDLIAYFYFEAKKEAGDGLEVEKSDYSYQSDIPSSKESGILMLSDISEAATRSQTNGMTEQDLRNFVHNLIQTKVQHGQLDNSTLTIGEFRAIEESIISTLKAKFHKRIVYPHSDDDNK